ncbi:MAG: response regulator transcription factor [Terriglobia bacterium]|jgi:DNA-binding NarL/FixJ family response regulator|nr:response regulator transcription factor [Terriglobia bacterium]
MQNCGEIANTQAHPIHQDSGAESLRVVIVDDSEDFRVVLRELLQMLFDVEIVGVGSNGFEALELTAELGPDLLIMDVNMPVLDGATAASLISIHFPTTTILMMSAEDSPETRERCLRSGARAFSPKAAITRQIAELQPRFQS